MKYLISIKLMFLVLVLTFSVSSANSMEAVPTKVSDFGPSFGHNISASVKFSFDTGLRGDVRNHEVIEFVIVQSSDRSNKRLMKYVSKKLRNNAIKIFDGIDFSSYKWKKNLTYTLYLLDDMNGNWIQPVEGNVNSELNEKFTQIKEKYDSKTRLINTRKDEKLALKKLEPKSFDNKYRKGIEGDFFNGFSIGRINFEDNYQLDAKRNRFGLFFIDKNSKPGTNESVNKLCTRHKWGDYLDKARRVNADDSAISRLYKKYEGNGGSFYFYSVENAAEFYKVKTIADNDGKLLAINASRNYDDDITIEVFVNSIINKFGRPEVIKEEKNIHNLFYGLSKNQANKLNNFDLPGIVDSMLRDRKTSFPQSFVIITAVVSTRGGGASYIVNYFNESRRIVSLYDKSIESCIMEKDSFYKKLVVESKSRHKKFKL